MASAQAFVDDFSTSFTAAQREKFFDLWLSLGIPFTVLLVASLFILSRANCRVSRVPAVAQQVVGSLVAHYWVTALFRLVILGAIVILAVWCVDRAGGHTPRGPRMAAATVAKDPTD